MESPVKPNVGQYRQQPGRIEHYTPGKSSVSDKEAKQVNIRMFFRQLLLPVAAPPPILSLHLHCILID